MSRYDMFENAKFGELYRTRDGRKAIFLGKTFWRKHYALSIEGFETEIYHLYDRFGDVKDIVDDRVKRDFTIVGKYKENET